MQRREDGTHEGAHPARRPGGGGPLHLLRRTMARAWGGSVFAEAAEAAFWQTLSLPPLLLGLLGSLGYVGDWLGERVVRQVQEDILAFTDTIFSDSIVTGIIAPTVDDILTTGKGQIVSVGFLISLWAGSSAIASFVDAITVAHDQHRVRNEVWQRIFALLLYLASLVLLVIGLPVVAIGPGLLPEFFPEQWRPAIASWLSVLYYPTVAVLLVLALATLYKLALPRKLPWHRGIPGAILAMVIFLLSSVGLRIYISWITTTGYTYGALATPIAFLLFTFFIALAIITGAYFNSAIQELWPAKMTRRQRRRWRRLQRERIGGRLRTAESATTPGAGTTPHPASGAGAASGTGAEAGTPSPADRRRGGTGTGPDPVPAPREADGGDPRATDPQEQDPGAGSAGDLPHRRGEHH